MSPDHGLHAAGCHVLPIPFDDGRLPGLLTACSDFFSDHYGAPAKPGALEALIADISPGKRSRDVFLHGIFDGSRLIGLVLLIRNFLQRRQWCLRTMLIVPERRGSGLGGAVYQALSTWSKQQGAASMLVAVLEANSAALRFWQRLGFAEVRRQAFSGVGVAMDLVHPFCHIDVHHLARPGRILATQVERNRSAPFWSEPGAVPGTAVHDGRSGSDVPFRWCG